jgi:hypothetical protein
MQTSSLFYELVMYAGRAGLYVSASGSIMYTIGTFSLDDYNTRTKMSAGRLSVVIAILDRLSADPAVAARIPDSIQWLFSLFLP